MYSSFTELRTTLYEALADAADEVPYATWYIVNLEEERDPHSLSAFLGLTYKQLCSVLQACDIMYSNHTNYSCILQFQRLESFLVPIDNVECTETRFSYKGGQRLK